MAIDMELENTVSLIAPVQFSVVRIVILLIQFSNTVQNTSYFIMYMFFFLLILWDFAVVDKLSVSFNKSSCPNRWGISLLYKLSLVMPHLSLGLEGGEGVGFTLTSA